ncbi:ARM repeat-containing protein [Thozetella sp. PMI_491]|nr:ARM repeat-containing protein [Thozetella sp. PMI_491]
MEQLPLPTSLEEAEALVRALYEPNPPETISRIQEVLQRLQRSPEGWQLAHGLAASPNDHVKFYAALTFIVKLNRDSKTLSEKDAEELLQTLLGWFMRSLEDGSAPLVPKKLCSTLVTFFIHFSHLWPNCIRHMLCCLDIGHSVSVDKTDEALPTPDLIGALGRARLRAAIWFASSLVGEVGKTDMASSKYIQVHERLAQNAADTAVILARGLSPPPDNPQIEVQGEALGCFQAWILYAQRVPGDTDSLVTPLRNLVDPAIQCFADQKLFSETTDLFSDVLTNYSSFFTEAHYHSLSALFGSQWAQEQYSQLIRGPHDETGISFGLLMLAYGDAKVQDLMQSSDAHAQNFLQGLSGLLACEGYTVGEDQIFVPALEFWSTFVETMIDCTYSEEASPQTWKPLAEQHLRTVMMNCWRKVQWPPVEAISEWDSSERQGFSEARKDVADLLQSVYTLNGLGLLSSFAELLLQYLPSQAWAEIEASIFCLGSLSDCISDNGEADTVLSKVFTPSLFELLSQSRGLIPIRLRQTGLSLIERYSEYFERHAEHLPAALNILFSAVGDPVLGGPSARSISRLCSSCRSRLVGEVRSFLGQYQTIYGGPAIDAIAEERILHGIACIIQAIPDEAHRLEAFGQLYSFVKRDFEESIRIKTRPETVTQSDPAVLRAVDPSSHDGVVTPDNISLQLALRAMRCLASMAKGLQDVKEYAIDLDGGPQMTRRSDGLTAVQSDIMNLIAGIQGTFNTSSEMASVICNVLRTGFSEVEPGPFVFPPELVTEFLTKQTFQTPGLGTFMSTACSLVGSLYRGPRVYVPPQLAKLLPWILSMIQALPAPDSDSEISQNGIYFVERVISKYPDLVFQVQPPSLLEYFFFFCIRVLDGQEPLAKNSVTDFWVAFITLKSDDPQLQDTIAGAMNHLGPLLARSLIRNFGGDASRTELDKLSEPLKKLVVHSVQAQAWLEQALFDPSFPSTQVSEEDKRVFLKRITGLRGARATSKVVREFWLACRGSNFAYVS